MANQIDITYFIGNLTLPVDEPGLQAKLLQEIKTSEPEIFSKVLGFDLYRAYLLGLAEVAPLQKWLDLRDGKEYTIDGVYYNWRGFTNTNKDSLIAYYIWCKFVQSDGSYISGSGTKQLKTENSAEDNTFKLLTLNYNRMVDMIRELDLFINTNIDDYPNYSPSVFEKILYII